jgi:homoserine acetyltransferase
VGNCLEILALEPKSQNFIPSLQIESDWLIANCYLQENLNNSKRPIEDAFMLCYAPDAGVFKVKFNRDVNTQLETFQVESWLNYHGEKLEKRFQLSAYKMMNQLLKNDRYYSE